MRILTRYILKETFSHSLLGLLVFSFVIYVRPLGRLLELVARHDLPFMDIVTLFVLPLPSILILTIPMAVLVGTLIGLTRMSADGEVIAARASGIGLGQFVRPVLIFALLGWAATSWMSLSLAPRAGRKLSTLEATLKASQIPHEVQPRVFLEQFPNLLLYLEDVAGTGSEWRGVFIADTTRRNAPKITLAESAMLVNDAASNRMTLHLERGTTHEIDTSHAERYSVISFTETDIPIPTASDSGAASAARRSPSVLSLGELREQARDPDKNQAARVELHYRFALPVAVVALALVGIPLGLATRKGGKAVGVMLAMLLVFLYYILMASGLSFSKQGRLDPAIGLWLANVSFFALGALMLAQVGRVRSWLRLLLDAAGELARRLRRLRLPRRLRRHRVTAHDLPAPRPAGHPLFQILDVYLFRGWLFYLAVMLVAFCGVYMIFDFFQLLGAVVRNHISPKAVVDYYRFLTPQVIYLMLPLSVLVATLINFGVLSKTNQVVAFKSVGVSVYRLSAPVLAGALVLSAAAFVLGDRYLPDINQRCDALRNQIKGRPAQTSYRPDRQWIFGLSNRIYNYRFFEPDGNVFAQVSVFDFDPQKFRLKRRISAARAFWEPPLQGWVFENGWVRELEGDRVISYRPFAVATFDDLGEEPGYFKKEVKPSAQMSAPELGRYIAELKQSGFDVTRLSVQYHRKFSFPLVAFVVALIGVPFSLTVGHKGAVSGLAISIGIAVVFWSVSSLFEAMGNLNQLPPIVAAWSPDVLFGLGGIYLLLRVRT